MISAEDLLKIVENDMLRDLSKILQRHGKSNTDYRIDEPNGELSRETIDSTTEIDDDAEKIFNNNFPLLTDEQKGILDILVGHVEQGEGGLYNLDAPGGSGKTFMANVLLSRV